MHGLSGLVVVFFASGKQLLYRCIWQMDQPSAAAAQRLAAAQLENYRQKLFCDVILSAVG